MPRGVVDDVCRDQKSPRWMIWAQGCWSDNSSAEGSKMASGGESVDHTHIGIAKFLSPRGSVHDG